MNAKTIVAIGLVLFAAAAVVAWGVREFGPASPAAAGGGPAEAEAAGGDGKLIVYYFHGDVRCATCNAIEAYAKEAIQTKFADRLADGRIEWRVANYEEPGNEHFKEQYELIASSVVLVAQRGGQQTDWKELERVWLLAGDREAFLEYVQDEVAAFLPSVEAT